MCRVTRVTNSCGHVNDHVEMVCHFAKPVSPEEPGAVLADSTNRPDLRTAPRYQDLMKLARPISPCPASRVSVTPTANEENHDHGGFHASTQPYCIYTTPRILTLQHLLKEYKCMVEGCERTG